MPGDTPAVLLERKPFPRTPVMQSVSDTASKCTRSIKGIQEPFKCKSAIVGGSSRHITSITPRVATTAAGDNSGSSSASSAATSLASRQLGSNLESVFPEPLVVASPPPDALQSCSDRDGVAMSSFSQPSASPMLSVTSPSVPVLRKDQKSSNSAGVAAAAPTRKGRRGTPPLVALSARVNETEGTRPLQYIMKTMPSKKNGGSQSTSIATALLSKNVAARRPAEQALNPKPESDSSSPQRAEPWCAFSTKPSQPAPLPPAKSRPRSNGATSEHSRHAAVPPEAGACEAGPPPGTVMALTTAKVAAVPSLKAWSPPMSTNEIPEHLPTDEPDVLVPVHKYVYDVKACAWKGVDTMVRVLHPNRGVSQGTMRVCFALEELDETGFCSHMVAKMFRHNISHVVESDYFNEGEAQCICGILAEKFNKVQVPKNFQRHVLSFLQCETVRIKPTEMPAAYQHKRLGFFSYRTTDSGDLLFTMEPRLEGNFTKYTSNFGGVYKGFEKRLSAEEEKKRHRILMAVEAFSHFTLVDSGGSMLVCDLQGVNDFLTDPQIHTEDGKGLGMGNMGQEGIDKWIEAHVCNEVCRAMQLKPLSKTLKNFPRTTENESRVSYYQVLRTMVRSQVPVQHEDIIPLSKPLSEMSDEEQLEYAMRLSALLSE